MLLVRRGLQRNSFVRLFLAEIRRAFACTVQEDINEDSCGLRDFL
jgi:hypothetical protein